MGKFGKCDFRELKEFQKKLAKINNQKEIDEFCRSCAKELAARLLAKVIKRTPVGQYSSGIVGGTLRRGWTTENEKQAMYTALFGGGEGGSGGTGIKNAVFGKGSSSENTKATAYNLEVTKVGNSYVIQIINPVDYASHVELGHRTRDHKGWVQGKFMLTISEDEIRNSAPAILERKLYKFMGECFS